MIDGVYSVADALVLVAQSLEFGARMVATTRPADRRAAEIAQAQAGDLRMWAAWLTEHPDVDEAMASLSSLAKWDAS